MISRPVSLILALSICTAVVVTGCRRKEVDAPESQPVPTEPPPTAASIQQQPTAGATIVQGVSTIESKDSAYTQEMTQTLNDFLGDYIKQNKKTPKDINEMVSLKIITSIPVLPGGKKWVINQQTGKISAQ